MFPFVCSFLVPFQAFPLHFLVFPPPSLVVSLRPQYLKERQAFSALKQRLFLVRWCGRWAGCASGLGPAAGGLLDTCLNPCLWFDSLRPADAMAWLSGYVVPQMTCMVEWTAFVSSVPRSLSVCSVARLNPGSRGEDRLITSFVPSVCSVMAATHTPPNPGVVGAAGRRSSSRSTCSMRSSRSSYSVSYRCPGPACACAFACAFA